MTGPLEAGLRSVDARQIVREALAGRGVGQRALDDVLTVVAELVTNAFRHAGGVTGFRVRPLPDAVAIEVSDASSVLPRSPGTPVSAPGGFGWLLVTKLARRTEIRSGRDGKTITAYLPLAAPAT
ncbi:ATP-binding protein [Streptomyces sp. NBC_01298]|uniref:ATP-binding protein n=1 Tax=Streptomyces sp. NBC_01298 TaxID=2903817 RepID=UPI002E1296A4|nr:ATP-binding protein [Streptomyces sp. NBC_01298]